MGKMRNLTTLGCVLAMLWGGSVLSGCVVSEEDSLDELSTDQELSEPLEGGGGGAGSVPPSTFVASTVLTLGDSYASGTGTYLWGSEYDDNGSGSTSGVDSNCWRDLTHTPGPRRAAAKGATSLFYACKGAEPAELTQQLDLAGEDHPSNAAAGWANTEILVTIGGNSVRTVSGNNWPYLIIKCITEVDPFGGCQNYQWAQIGNWSQVQADLTATYGYLAEVAPNAKVAIMMYPPLMVPYKGWLGVWHCPNATGISGNEARWIDAQVATLNSKITNAIAATKAAYPSFNIRAVPVASYMAGGACNGVAINRPDLAHINSDAQLHPSGVGYYNFYQAFVAYMGN